MSITDRYYNTNAKAYFESTIKADVSFLRDKFIDLIPNGGHILDLGCGSGRDSKVYLNMGFQVSAFSYIRQDYYSHTKVGKVY